MSDPDSQEESPPPAGDGPPDPQPRAPIRTRPTGKAARTAPAKGGAKAPLPETVEAALDHIGIAVASLEKALPAYRAVLGLDAAHEEDVPAEGVRVAFLPLAAGGAIELLEPIPGASSAAARFLVKRGPGIHHLSFRVPDCRAAIRAAEAAGIRPLPPAPRKGSRGSLVAFFDPRDTGGVLIEICERRPRPG